MAVNLGMMQIRRAPCMRSSRGAFCGEDGIPERWRKILAKRPVIESFAERLMKKGSFTG